MRVKLACVGVAMAAAVVVGSNLPAAVPAIRVNQVGYLPAMAKAAMVVSDSAAGTFVVRRSTDGKDVFRGTLSPARDDGNSGDRVRVADFTRLQAPGTYYLDVPGVGSSWPFSIGPDVYRRPYYLAMRSFYGQRCGTAVDLGPEYPGYTHDICHLQGAWHATSGRSGPKAEGNRGWHDAGDYGRYVVNSGITTGTLLWAYEFFADRIGVVNLRIPESGDRIPDLLDEVRWNLDWMLSMQDAAGGGVFHKQTSEVFPGFVMPERDSSVSYAIGTGTEPFTSTCASGDFAAVMAIAARVYRPYDAAFASRALEASRRAYQWAVQHPAVLFTNPRGVSTGAYGDRDCGDEVLWAAAELWRTTKEPAFEAYVIDHRAAYMPRIASGAPPSWANVAPMALWTYVLGGATGTAAGEIRQATVTAADAVVQRTAADGYRTSLTGTDYIWGSNSVAANYGLQLHVAHTLSPKPAYLEAAADNLHYLLGRNALSLSYVTGVGADSVRHPHHRPSGADANAEPWPGLLAGGPNARRQDPAMKALPDLPPARMFLDDQESYATNEIAINWNAPLVFLLAAQVPVTR